MIASTDYASYPALAGDLAYDYADGSENAYIITVSVGSGTAGTFVKMNA